MVNRRHLRKVEVHPAPGLKPAQALALEHLDPFRGDPAFHLERDQRGGGDDLSDAKHGVVWVQDTCHCRDRWHLLGNRVLAARLRLDVRPARRAGGARALTICCARYEILASLSARARSPASSSAPAT